MKSKPDSDKLLNYIRKNPSPTAHLVQHFNANESDMRIALFALREKGVIRSRRTGERTSVWDPIPPEAIELAKEEWRREKAPKRVKRERPEVGEGDSEGLHLGSAKGIKTTDKGALLVEGPGIRQLVGVSTTWIPISCLHDDSEVFAKGDEGKLVVKAWFAKQKGWAVGSED